MPQTPLTIPNRDSCDVDRRETKGVAGGKIEFRGWPGDGRHPDQAEAGLPELLPSRNSQTLHKHPLISNGDHCINGAFE